MRYALLICDDETTAVTADERADRMVTFTAFADAMRARGVLLASERLRPTAAATTVRVRAGDVVIADGPFAETREQIAGLYIVECSDLDEAIEVASRHPAALYGTIEVRPVWEM